MNVADRLRVGSQGLVSRPARTALSAIGIALGITALVAVMGLTQSSKADVNAQLKSLGTNLLVVKPGESMGGSESVTLPVTAPAMIRQVPTVESVGAVRIVPNVVARKSDYIPTYQTGGLSILSADLDLAKVVGATLRSGRWFDKATVNYPMVVLGDAAARRLGAEPGQRVWMDGRWFAVIGVLKPVTLAQSLDSAVLMGDGVAKKLYGDLPPSAIYTRIVNSSVVATREVLGVAADPAAPNSVAVTRPSDALAAQAAIDKSMTRLTLGLGAVALLVGAVGIANVMVISVLERRREIGVRRALGATRVDIGGQFLTESTLLSFLGGVVGVVLGLTVTIGWSLKESWLLVIPWAPIGIGLVCSLLVGSVIGLYPAMRAASVPPTEALRSA